VESSLIFKHFPDLSQEQQRQFNELKSLYVYWNEQINVISRKDMDNFYTHHVLHSLAIAKVVAFKDGAEVLDVGTGGGFPGIPLAILFPNVKFHLVDSIGKKILVVKEVAQALGLKNVTSQHERAEKINHQYDFIVSRAVTAMPEFLRWVRGKVKKENMHELPNGILYLKGGDLTEELKGIKHHIKIYNLSDFFQEEFFETKKVVYVR
jgi:16S rRNA (guanine527-N7)-methyltransferase